MCSADRYRFLLDYHRVPKTHPWAIPGTKVDYAIDESVRLLRFLWHFATRVRFSGKVSNSTIDRAAEQAGARIGQS